MGGPNNKDYNILGSILGSPYFGKLPFGTCPKTLLGHCRIQVFVFTVVKPNKEYEVTGANYCYTWKQTCPQNEPALLHGGCLWEMHFPNVSLGTTGVGKKAF